MVEQGGQLCLNQLYLGGRAETSGVMPLNIRPACCIAVIPLCAVLLTLSQEKPGATDASKTGSNTVFRIGGSVTAPRLIYAPDPEYPEEARRMRYQGSCVLELIVDSDGKPRDVRVVKPLGMGLDEKAAEAVRAWRFDPARKDGNPVAVQMNVDVSFRLDNHGSNWAMPAHLPPPVSTEIRACPPSSSTDRERPSGEQTSIVQLSFEGDLQLPTADRDRIAAMVKQRTYSGSLDAATAEALELIRSAWQNDGYIKVQVSDDAKVLTSTPLAERIALDVHVFEGQQYRLGGITFKNNKAISNVHALRDQFPIKDGDLFDREKIAEGLDALRKAYGQLGYINLTSIPETVFDDVNRLIYLEIEFDEGREFYISGINILGVDELAVQRATQNLLVKPGDVYNQRLVDLSLQTQLSSLPADVPIESHVHLEPNERAGTVAVTIDLRQCPAD
jgi:TonB family protein